MKSTIKPVRMALKILVIVILLLFNYSVFLYTCQTAAEAITADDDSYQWRYLHELVAEGSYGDLRSDLHLYDYYSGEYDGLWAVTDAYHYHCLFTTASRTALNTEDPTLAEQAEAQAEEALEKLREVPEDTEDETARRAISKIKEKK